MGRRLEALHAQAGVRLLQKTPEGFMLTQAGERVLASVKRIEIEALSVERAITREADRGRGQDHHGRFVRRKGGNPDLAEAEGAAA
jgi:DNA-binding transcriptional LysR family regulator